MKLNHLPIVCFEIIWKHWNLTDSYHKANKEALIEFCSVVKYTLEAARALKKYGETLDFITRLPLQFFCAPAFSCVLYNRTEHSQGFFIC